MLTSFCNTSRDTEIIFFFACRWFQSQNSTWPNCLLGPLEKALVCLKDGYFLLFIRFGMVGTLSWWGSVLNGVYQTTTGEMIRQHILLCRKKGPTWPLKSSTKSTGATLGEMEPKNPTIPNLWWKSGSKIWPEHERAIGFYHLSFDMWHETGWNSSKLGNAVNRWWDTHRANDGGVVHDASMRRWTVAADGGATLMEILRRGATGWAENFDFEGVGTHNEKTWMIKKYQEWSLVASADCLERFKKFSSWQI